MSRRSGNIRNKGLQRDRSKALRRRHDYLVDELTNNPELLGVSQQSVIWKSTDYYLSSPGYQAEKGGRERHPAADLIFLYEDGSNLRFLVVEVKNSFLGRRFYESGNQIERSETYFRDMWKSVIIHDLKDELLARVSEGPEHRSVYLDMLYAAKELGELRYCTSPYLEGLHLGELRVKGDSVQFIEPSGYAAVLQPPS